MESDMITPAQIRAARGLLGWSQDQLATAANVGLSTLKDAESGKRDPIASNIEAIRWALEAAGVKFIPANGDGPGVRLAGHLPQIIRKPTQRNSADLIPFMVAWRNRKLIVFLPSTVLDDLDRTNYYSDPEYIGAFGKHEKLILRKTAAAIDAGRIDQEGRVQLTSDDFFR